MEKYKKYLAELWEVLHMEREFMKKRIIDMLEEANEENMRIIYFYVRTLLR